MKLKIILILLIFVFTACSSNENLEISEEETTSIELVDDNTVIDGQTTDEGTSDNGSNSSDGNEPQFNIVGKRNFYSKMENGVETLYDSCYRNTHFELHADGTGRYVRYSLVNGVCEYRYEYLARWIYTDGEYTIQTTPSGSWSGSGGNPYSSVVIYNYSVTVRSSDSFNLGPVLLVRG